MTLGCIAMLMLAFRQHSGGPFPASDEEVVLSMRIDINRAGRKDLEALPGIGSVLAGRIVLDRESHGPFAAVEDMARVRGIGPALVGRIRTYVEAVKSDPSVGPVDNELGGGQKGRVEGR